ncbi:MAG: hypothetical protein KatS3mg064_1836 [Tepidiforma sp.]|nr:hypothetical protein [Tepidiforma sp.]GIW18679.1 MAG: hypothetical protein KatS3mg064_1836 [Tepidiforma sp.]
MTERTYPADQAEAGLRLFLGWFGPHYARSVSVEGAESDGTTLAGNVVVGRRWKLHTTVINTFGPDATVAWEAGRAAIERRLDAEGRGLAIWVPRGAVPPSVEPGLSQLVLALEAARRLDDGRLEFCRPVELYLRRVDRSGSVVTVLGGLAGHWARFTNRVPGTFQLNSNELFRLPASEDARQELAERIVMASQQPEVDESITIEARDCWTANDLGGGGSCVLGTPAPENDEWSASLRRNLRRLLKAANEAGAVEQADARALVILGPATYAEEEKLSWALRGMDPSLFAGYDILAVIADGVVKPVLLPGRSVLPWDAPLR